MIPRVVVMLGGALGVACVIAACGFPIAPQPIEGEGSFGEGEGEGEGEGVSPVAAAFFFADATNGARSRVVDRTNPDQTESVTAETVLDYDVLIGVPYQMETIESLDIDVDGHLARYDEKVRVTVPRGAYTRHVVATHDTRSVSYTRPGSSFSRTIDGDEPWVVSPPSTTELVNSPPISIAMARLLKRMTAHPSAWRAIDPVDNVDVALGADLFPPDADDVTELLDGAEYVSDATYVKSVTDPIFNVTMTRDDGASQAQLDTPLVAFDVDDDEPELTVPACDPAALNATSRALTATVAGVAIPIELDVPASASSPSPARVVVVPSGSGGALRDFTFGGVPLFTCLAHDLLAQGIAVARYDDVVFPTAGQPSPYSMTDRDARSIGVTQAVDDEIAGDASLQGGLFVLGHSEGVTHAIRTAIAVPDVAGVVLVAGIAENGLDAVTEQGPRMFQNAGFSDAIVDAVRTQNRAFYQGLLDSTAPDTSSPDGVFTLAFWKQILSVDGAAEAVTAARPTLVVQGGRDWQVVPENADAFEAALTNAGVEVDVERFDDLGHFQTPSPDAAPGFAEEYGAPYPWDARVTSAIASFVLAH